MSWMKKNSSGLLSQLFNFGLGPLIGMGISMLTVPVTTRLVSPEEYGKSSLFTLFQSVFLLAGLLGLDQSYARFYNDEKIDKQKLLFHVTFFPLCVSVFLIVLLLVFQQSFSHFLFGSYEIDLIIATCFFIPVLIINRFALLQIRMDLRGRTYSFLNIVTQLVNFIVLVLLLFLYEKSFRAIVYSIIVGQVVATVIILFFVKTEFNWKKLQIDWDLSKNLFYFGIPLVPAALLSWLLNSFDKVGLRAWSTFDELGLYAAAFKIVAILSALQNIFTTAWIPVAYKWYEQKIPDSQFEMVSVVVSAVMSLGFAGIVLFRNIIMLFLGSEYRGTESILVFLLFVPVMYTISETTTLGITFSKKTIFNVYVAIIAVVLNIVGNYFLIPIWGAQGAAISTCISYIGFFFARTFFSRKLWFNFKVGIHFFNIFLLLTLSLIVFFKFSFIFEVMIFIMLFGYNGFMLKTYFMSKAS